MTALSSLFDYLCERNAVTGNPVDGVNIEDYLALTGHRSDVEGALFRPVKNNRTGRLDRHLDPASVYQNIVRKYGLLPGQLHAGYRDTTR